MIEADEHLSCHLSFSTTQVVQAAQMAEVETMLDLKRKKMIIKVVIARRQVGIGWLLTITGPLSRKRGEYFS